MQQSKISAQNLRLFSRYGW